MGLINAETFVNLVEVYRIIWIKGRFGGGKSALAYRIAYELVKKGFCKHILSNIQDVWSSSFEDIQFDENDLLSTVIIADEGGLFLRYGRDVEEFLTLLRKLNIVLLIPSVLPPSQRVRFFSVQRVMNLNRVGLPMWVYRWTLNYGGEIEKEFFVWYQPSEIFGVFDTKSPPVDDAGISEWLVTKKDEVRKRLGYQAKRRNVIDFDDESSIMDKRESTFDPVLEAAESIEGSISVYAEAVNSRRRKR